MGSAVNQGDQLTPLLAPPTQNIINGVNNVGLQDVWSQQPLGNLYQNGGHGMVGVGGNRNSGVVSQQENYGGGSEMLSNGGQGSFKNEYYNSNPSAANANAQLNFVPYVYSHIAAGNLQIFSQDGSLSYSETEESGTMLNAKPIKRPFMISPAPNNYLS